MINFLSAVSLLLLPFMSYAQGEEGTAAPTYAAEYSFHVGSLLPNQIDGVTEILPTVGLRYAMPLNFGGLEAGFTNSHAHGVDYKLFSASFRGDLAPMPDLIALFYIGPDFHYYSPVNETRRVTNWGFHVGAGVEMHLGGPLYMRGDMKFNMNPGTALYIGFGVAVRLPDGGGGGGGGGN